MTISFLMVLVSTPELDTGPIFWTRLADATTRPNPTLALFENWGSDPTHRTANTNSAIDADKTEALS